MEGEEHFEYECPECGAGFRDGAKRCPKCGLEIDWSEETDFECPDCGATIPHDAKECPDCGAQFIVEPAGSGGGIDEMLDAAVKETMVTPKTEVPAAEVARVKGADEEAVDEKAEVEGPSKLEREAPAEVTVKEWVEESPPSGAEAVGEGEAGGVETKVVATAVTEAGEASVKRAKKEVAEEKGTSKTAKGAKGAPLERAAEPKTEVGPGRYAGGFTRLGILFIVLAGMSLVLTIVALRWDSISTDSPYETIGRMQSMVIALGIVGFVVCAGASIYDLVHGPKGTD